MFLIPTRMFCHSALLRRLLTCATCLLSASSAVAQSPAPDSFMYYQRTHGGALPPPGVNTSDHSGETTNVIAASTNVMRVFLPPGPLYNGVDPTNLGKGDWIWQMPQTETRLGVADVQSVINYETNIGMKWITVKCGDGGSIYSQFSSDLVTRAHTAGLKIFGWAYDYGNNAGHYGSGSSQSANINGEINVALNCLALGADGFIIDAEIEYETNATRAADATTFANAIKTNYPTRFLAHAPFPYINSHSGFPYIQFGILCDAVMPQDYWGAIGISAQTMVVNMNSQWRTWQNGLTGSNTNAIKPIIPLGQSYAPVTGAQISAFMLALQTNSPKATAAGYNGVSFWDCQERNADMDAAVLAISIGGSNTAPFFVTQPLLSYALEQGTSTNFSASASGTAPLSYRWYLNGSAIAGATNTTLAVTNVQTTNGGNYTVVVTNSGGAVTSSPVLLVVYPTQTTVFSDNFDVNSSANWTLNESSADNSATFSFDYSTVGIPSAPHSAGGTTRGLQMKANLSAGAVAALSLSPVGQSFSGDYRLHFDGWINVNGPLPGGTGSTEFLTAGLGTAGNRTEWTGSGSTADGYYFSIDGDGGVAGTSTTSGDFCAYGGTTLLSTGSGVYAEGIDSAARDNSDPYYTAFLPGASAPAAQLALYSSQTGSLAAGSFGMGWHDVIVSRRGTTVDYVVDGIRLASISNCVITSSNVFIGYWDPFSSLSANNAINFGLVDNLRVEVTAVAPAITAQPQSQTVGLGSNATFSVTASGLPIPGCQWQLNGTNLPGATATNYVLTGVKARDAGVYSVVLTNVAGTLTSSNATFTVAIPHPNFLNFLAQPGGIQIQVGGVAGSIYAIDYSTNLNTGWSQLATFTNLTGTYLFSDPAWTSNNLGFYRARFVGP